MAIQIKETEYLNYGRCVHISNGIIEVMVTIDVGPRIIHFSLVNGENMLFTDQDRKYRAFGEEFDQLYGEGSVFYNYGGHRLWLSPESTPDTYYPDNEPVVYGILSEGVSFLPARQKHNDIQIGFEVMMNENTSDIMVVHSAKNCSKDPKTLALWAITMMAPGGFEIIPQNQGEDPLQPDRSLILWPDSDLRDPRVFWGNRFITMRHDSSVASAFKIGMNNRVGWAAYLRKNVALIKRYVHNVHAAYPDFGASYESYTNGDFLEMESLSPLYHIEPGNTVRHVENLTLQRIDQPPKPDDEASLDAFAAELG